MAKEKIKEKNIGKICPLCKEGIIVYVKGKVGGGFAELGSKAEFEMICCSNEKCKGNIKL